jgi:Concanavalin A-like lectin/glucanases superfamily
MKKQLFFLCTILFCAFAKIAIAQQEKEKITSVVGKQEQIDKTTVYGNSLKITLDTSSIIGIPTKGEMGITIPVKEIIEKTRIADLQPKVIRKSRELEVEKNKAPNPDAPKVASWPVENNKVTGILTPTQAFHSNFLALTLTEASSVPPDNMGDIGTTQVCIASNGRIKFFARNTVCATAQTTTTGTSNTTLGAPALNADIDAFFAPVISPGISGVSDPHVRFDRATNRWFVIAIDLKSSSNRCVIAVSSGPTVTSLASFTYFFFVFDALGTVPPAPYAGGFFDYPTLGVDANALYIGGRMFNGSGTAYTGASVFVVRKSSILGAGPIVTTAFHQLGTSTTGIYTPQGVDNDDPTATSGYVIGVDQAVFSKLDIHRISNPGGTPIASALIALTVPTTSTPLNQVNSLAGNTLDVNDDRLFAAMIRKNKITGVSSLWTAHAVAVNTTGVGANSGTGRRNGARWYQIDNLATTPTITQSGTVFDNAATNPRGFIFPSIGTSGQGHSAIGFTTSSPVNFIDAGISGRYRTDASGTTQPFSLATAASTTYSPSSDSNPFRWGDYTQTVVDPLDDMTMWSFVQYCNAANSWGVRAIQIKAPPPATPIALGTLPCGNPNASNIENAITLNGTSVNNSEFFDPGTGYANRLNVSTTGAGASINNITFVSPTQITFNILWPPSLAGTTQTLTITNPDCQSITTTYSLPTVTFTAQPASTSVCANTNASFSTTVNGIAPFTYQWQRSNDNGANWNNVAGANAATYSFTTTFADNGSQYRCVAGISCGITSNSNPATLTIAPTPTAPNLTASGPTTFCQGGSVTLNSNVGNNNALNFVKTSSQYVSVPHSASINLGATFTMEAWVRYSGVNVTILDKGDYDFLWQLNTDPLLNTNSLRMGFYTKNTGAWSYSTGIVPQNTWTHVAITLNAGTLTFYINGVASGTASVTFSQDNQPMNIGRQQPTFCACNHFNGTMDELRLWNVVRTPAQMLTNMNSTIPTNSAGLVAYYKFDEGTGSTTADATGNGNNGTLVNSPTWQVPATSPVNAVVWSPGGATTPSIVATTSGTYTATATNGYGCSTSSSTIINVNSNAALVTLASPADDYATGMILKTASSVNGKITATNKITGTANVSYFAKSIELNAGFKADNGTMFIAQNGGCN